MVDLLFIPAAGNGAEKYACIFPPKVRIVYGYTVPSNLHVKNWDMASVKEHIDSILDTLPTKPGCYLMKDSGGKIIYVQSDQLAQPCSFLFSILHRTFFENPASGARYCRYRLDRGRSELESAHPGNESDQETSPQYNVRLKDDKRYPYIKAHWNEPFPKVTVTRNVENDGGKYYGPYTAFGQFIKTLICCARFFNTAPAIG